MTEAGKPIRWGIVGLGKFASEALLPAIGRSQHAVAAACATRDPAKAREFAARFAIPAVYDSAAELVRDAAVDAVYVATPNGEHVPVVLAAAAAGKHVLCEKPLALDLAAGIAAVRACDEAGVILRLGLHLRFEASLKRIAEILRDGRIGKVRALSIERSAPLDERVPWRTDPEQGGSVLYDVGVHLLDLVPRLVGAGIASVSALASPPPSGGVSADTITMLLRLENGVQATARISREAPYTASDLVVIGTEGMLRTGPLRWVDKHNIAVTTAAGLSEEAIPAADLYRDQLDAFADDVADRGARLATGEDGLRLIAAAQAVEKALT
ncbi:MAG TPA: Gfo/Idh/MocA family oxidoreductase [Stellaceae bacterium]|nr:Gfo/Idh/MocA family oxidoreductase [Stellaceae bacterium]